jgi:acyl carrier protein
MDTPMESRVRSVIGRTFRLERVPPTEELVMGQLPAWDSLGHMTLLAELEQEFKVQFPTFVLATLTTVPAIVQELERSGVK